MYPDAVPAGYHHPSWEPKELGPAKSTAIAVLILALMLAFGYGAFVVVVPPRQPEVIQVTQAQLVTIPAPKPPPPPPPKIIPPPKPLPVVIPKPPPIPSKITVATKPPPPVHHIIRIQKPRPHIQPPVVQPVTQPPPTPAPAAPPAPRTDGIGPYGQLMHQIIQANQDVPPALASLGISGEAVIHVLVAPDGHVVSASVISSSGNPLIDQTALDHVREARFPPFRTDMPDQTIPYNVPVEIDATQ